MLPIILNPSSIRVGLAGAGEALERRRASLAEAGIVPVEIESDASTELSGLDVLYIAGLPKLRAERLAHQAKVQGALVNVEDVPELCDFHAPATVRRGDLLVTVSTGGRAPGLAKLICEWISGRIGSEWSGYLDTASARRADWRSQGLPPSDVSCRLREFVAERNWLS